MSPKTNDGLWFRVVSALASFLLELSVYDLPANHRGRHLRRSNFLVRTGEDVPRQYRHIRQFPRFQSPQLLIREVRISSPPGIGERGLLDGELLRWVVVGNSRADWAGGGHGR